MTQHRAAVACQIQHRVASQIAFQNEDQDQAVKDCWLNISFPLHELHHPTRQVGSAHQGDIKCAFQRPLVQQHLLYHQLYHTFLSHPLKLGCAVVLMQPERS